MRENSIFSALWKSFYSQSLYRDVRRNWRFSVVGYIFILVVLYTVIAVSLEAGKLNKYFENCFSSVLAQIPTGKIVDGKMSVEQPSPYTVYYQEKDKPQQVFAIFDMTNKTPAGYQNAFSVFHSNGYFYDTTPQAERKPTSNDSKAMSYTFHSYPSQGSISFSAGQAQDLAKKFKHLLTPALFISVGILMLIFKLCQPIFYALIGLFFGGIVKIHLTYGEAYRLAIIASTPAFLLISMGKFFLPIPHPWWIAFIIEMVYLYFAVYSNRQGSST
jgi:hypothetical protein